MCAALFQLQLCSRPAKRITFPLSVCEGAAAFTICAVGAGSVCARARDSPHHPHHPHHTHPPTQTHTLIHTLKDLASLQGTLDFIDGPSLSDRCRVFLSQRLNAAVRCSKFLSILIYLQLSRPLFSDLFLDSHHMNSPAENARELETLLTRKLKLSK